ncbi:DUF1569 domain-containing protein [Flavobacterium sp.]|uniref:DUF1569 domain-containing protein n=1 Tax=Flavobacterium sp. TaxID=239 RepID=UPI00344D2288
MIQNIFDKQVSDALISRINNLQPNSEPLWGKMSVDQMLAHCNVSYLFTYHSGSFIKPSPFKKFMLKTFVKKMVVSEKPYQKNGRTAPEFIIAGTKDFEREKNNLIDNINKTQQLGANHFDGKDNFSFGKMSSQEWNNMFYKHLDHHLSQFNV